MMCVATKLRCIRFALASAVVLTTGTAFAKPPEDGSTWAGMITAETGKTMVVVARFTKGAVSLRFDEPAGCTITAGQLGTGGDSRTYRFRVPQNGGPFCAKLYQGDVSVNATAIESMVMTFQRDKTAWTGKLERVGDK